MADPLSNQAAPDPYATADDAAIIELVRRKRDEWARGRENIVRAAYRNLLFYRSHQWLMFDAKMGRFRPAVLKPGTPTPVTNRFASTIDAVTSVFARIEPRLNFRPGNPEEPEDRATADVAIRAIGVVEDEVKIRFNRQMLASWVGLTGQAWIETGYDADPVHGMVSMTVDACTACGATQAPGMPMCEGCGQTGMLQPTEEQAPRGKMYVDVVPIFEMFFDASITDWSKQREYIREKSVGLDEAKRRWPQLAEQITANASSGPDEMYADSLPLLGPALTAGPNPRQMMTHRPQANKVTEQWYWSLPTEQYPQGLLAIVVGKTHVAYKGPLPYGAKLADGSKQPFLPHVEFPQKLVPGTGFAKTVADDIALLQSKRNRWESIVEACGMRVGMPIWMRPRGSNASSLTGDPGQIVDYNAIPGSTAKPERIQGQGIPLAYIQKIQMIDKDFEELAATFDVIKGARPEGVSAGIALQILQERGMSRYGPLFILWEQAWAEWGRQALEIFREYATEDRLLKIKGRNGEWEVEKFVGADLQGSVDVIPEAGSSMPRSSLVERAETEQLIAQGILDRTDPEVRFKVLEMYGKTYMLPGLEADTKNAIKEDEAFEALAQHPEFRAPVSAQVLQNLQTLDYLTIAAQLEGQGIQIPRVRAAVDDHGVHSREHGQWLKAEGSQTLPQVVQIIAEKHKEYHDQLRLQQAQAIQQAAGQAPNAQAGFTAPPPAQTNVLNTSSSQQRMQGDMAEMGADMAAGQTG